MWRPPATTASGVVVISLLAMGASHADEVIEIEQVAPPGSVHTIGKEDLERFEHDDIHKVLASVPGVYVREEDGYGLKPNIGMRGADSDRSSKIAIMEDGILAAPAPYSAPAAYYFPLVTRMSSVEVTKGPGSILYGPNTVGGAINLFSSPFPNERKLALDVAGGTGLYGKLHLFYGERFDRGGFLIEGAKLRSDGFKQLDGGGTTGFDKHDILFKGRVHSAPGSPFQSLELKLGWSNEASEESYVGLAERDFASAPHRRYAGTQLDRMDWQHGQFQLTHRIEMGGGWSLGTTGYHHVFSRKWRKLEGLGGAEIGEVLANPAAMGNDAPYELLTGARDSVDPVIDTLRVASNQRDYVSQGLQIAATKRFERAGVLEIGGRLHRDTTERFHTMDDYLMHGGQMVNAGMPTETTKDDEAGALASAGWVRHRYAWNRLEVTWGARVEVVLTDSDDHREDEKDVRSAYVAVMPGAGVVLQLVKGLAVLGGVHRGFLPVAPSHQGDASPERSLNYEVGVRYANSWTHAEVIGFFNDYDNLKGICQLSNGCSSSTAGDEFDGGAARIYGTEASAVLEPRVRGITFPMALAYTFTRTELLTTFNSDNDLFGDVVAGDEMPYIPRHQLTGRGGVRGNVFEASVAARWIGPMRDNVGQGAPSTREGIDASLVVDVAGSYSFGRAGSLYATIDNLFDEVSLVARQPIGVRAGISRLFVLGYKYQY